MNSVTITGRLTADPIQRFAGETPVCDMRVAIPRRPSVRSTTSTDTAASSSTVRPTASDQLGPIS